MGSYSGRPVCGPDRALLTFSGMPREVAIPLGIIAVIALITLPFVVPEDTVSDRQFSAVLFGAAVIIAIVPRAWHFILFMKLEVSLFNRIGPIWGEGKTIRSARFYASDFIQELNSIERRFGSELTAEERSWLETSRQQHRIAMKWAIAVFVGMVILIFFISSF